MRVFITLFFLFFAGTNLFGQNKIKQEQIEKWDVFKSTQENTAKIKWNRTTGSVTSLYGIKSKSYTGTPLQAAILFLKENYSMLGLKDNIADLQFAKTFEFKDNNHISFNQFYKGLPVFTGEFIVNLDDGNHVYMVIGNYYTEIDLNTTSGITENEAINTATDHLGYSQDLTTAAETELIVFPHQNDFLLAYKIKLDYSPQDVVVCFVDANSNTVIKTQSRIAHSVTGKGNVYPIDPVNSSLVQNQPLYRLAGNGYLDGDFADVTHYNTSRAYSFKSFFLYSTTDIHFDEANAYYHVDRVAKDYFSDLLSYTQSPVDVIIAISPGGPSYNPDLNRITLVTGDSVSNGDGEIRTRNSARKDDMIYHEYTHSVTHHLGQFRNNDESFARNEAYSDYFAASFTNSWELGEWLFVDYDNARVLNTDPAEFNYKNWQTVSYGFNSPNPYGRSMIWSGALWDLHEQLGQTIADLIIFEGLILASGNTKFEAGRDGIIQADIDRYAGVHEQTILDIFQARGIGKPYTPAAFSMSQSSNNHPKFDWQLNGEPDIDGYRIYRSLDGAPYSLLVELSNTTSSYTDNGVEMSNSKFDPLACYKVAAVDIHDQESDWSSAKCTRYDGLNKINGDCVNCGDIPSEFKLSGAFPNPFNNVTNIQLALPESYEIEIAVYSMLGQKVLTLGKQNLSAGYHKIAVDGASLSSGVYIYTVKALNRQENKQFFLKDKFILIK